MKKQHPPSVLCLFLLLLSGICGYSQIIATLPSQTACPGSFSVPVSVEGFDSVASVSVKINYDSAILSYDGHSGLNPVFSSGVFMINSINQQVIFSWFSLSPATIGTGELLTLHFHHLLNQSSLLSWDETPGSCAFTDISGTELPAVFNHASITTSFQPPQPVSPPDLSVHVNENTVLQWNGSGCAPLYDLEYTTDPEFLSNVVTVSGIFGTSHAVNNLLPLTTYYWKVKASIPDSPFATDWSGIFSFTTRQPDGLDEGGARDLSLSVFPLPADDRLNVEIDSRITGKLDYTLSDPAGRQMTGGKWEMIFSGRNVYHLDTRSLRPGPYLFTIHIETLSNIIHKSIQIIISR